MKDCETCISIDPSFIKAYIRKAALYMLKREYYKAIEVLETAQSKDLEGKHRTEIHNEMARAQTALYGSQSGASEEETTRNAMKDPEVAAILTDPAMRIILQQMQEDPKAAQDHLSNPDVAAKVKKLVQAGVIKIGRN
jgi:stress-induced-phosphoprotein 1